MAQEVPIERLFKCTRCKVRFPFVGPARNLGKVKCPRSCPAPVEDVTESTVETYAKLRAEHKKNTVAREASYEETAKAAQEEAILLAKKRGER